MPRRFENTIEEINLNASQEKVVVSVIVITYNHEEYIIECLEGILNQEIDVPWELIVCDHSSDDRTYEITCKTLSDAQIQSMIVRKDRSNMKFVNGRPTGNSNLVEMIERSRGEFIAICAGDDVWIDNAKLQNQTCILRDESDVNIVWTNTLSGKTRETAIESIKRKEFFELADYRYSNPNGDAAGTVLFRRSSLDTKAFFNEFSSVPYEDWTLHMLCLRFGKGVRMQSITAFYRQHESSMMKGLSYIEKTLEKIQSINYYQDYFTELDYSDFRKVQDSWLKGLRIAVIQNSFHEFIRYRGTFGSIAFFIRRILGGGGNDS